MVSKMRLVAAPVDTWYTANTVRNLSIMRVEAVMDKVEALGTLHQLERYLNRSFSYALQALPISEKQATVLLVAWRGAKRGERVCQRDAEERLALRGSSVTSLVNALTEKGFLRRERTAEDGRVRYLVPTEEGMRLGEKVWKTMEEFTEEVFAGIPDSELEGMLATAKTTMRNCGAKEDDS